MWKIEVIRFPINISEEKGYGKMKMRSFVDVILIFHSLSLSLSYTCTHTHFILPSNCFSGFDQLPDKGQFNGLGSK